ncbi:MAG: chemotaxis-specific protein-glutamate methyltransferase CheB [Spirochaetales bacterium]|nr:chemotaxis-specific protein-glutamate methyltransferase CheB [Spirochaetales bacterium]
MKQVLIIDDSRLFRRVTVDILADLPGVQVHEAANGEAGLAVLEKEAIDLVVLDVEMPVMDGLETLRMIKKKGLAVPVIMQSALTRAGAEITLQALELGAADFIPKPAQGQDPMELRDLLLEKVRAFLGLDQAPEPRLVRKREQRESRFDLLVIGSSTGGPQALQLIFQRLPADFTIPILVVQHMPPVFTRAFADRLNSISPLTVMEARDGLRLSAGQAYLAQGGFHLALSGHADDCQLRISDAPPLHSHRPSIDFTIYDAVSIYGGRIMGLIMTGMGRDGVDGMGMIYGAGGLTLAQDEPSSVIYGMNRRAVEAGVIDQVLALGDIPEQLVKHSA